MVSSQIPARTVAVGEKRAEQKGADCVVVCVCVGGGWGGTWGKLVVGRVGNSDSS